MSSFLDKFKVIREREDFEAVVSNIDKGLTFRGTNLWILIFAIFIASLGLNVNSTAVIIGAMLVSPLMGPIMGMGFGMAVNDLPLFRKAISNYLIAAVAGLLTSTLYFMLSPINDAHSEILARTAPNIYDVLIAFFGGLAGSLAVTSKQKGNVIPGVAIATALMPPLCTAGYGLATLQWNFFFGAFYLFIINTVFIAISTLLTVRLMRFPYKHLPTEKEQVAAKRVAWVIVIITLLPSIYFGYDIVQQNKFLKKAGSFVDNEAVFKNDYLLKKDIDAKRKTIVLTFGGEKITEAQIAALKKQLKKYGLEGCTLEIHQGFAYLTENKESATKENEQLTQLTKVLNEKEDQLQLYKHYMDSLGNQKILDRQVFNEIHVQHPEITAAVIQPAYIMLADSLTTKSTYVLILSTVKPINSTESKRLEAWLKVRLNTTELKVLFERAR